MRERIGIVGWGSCSALGHDTKTIWETYNQTDRTCISRKAISGEWVAQLPDQSEHVLQTLRNSNKNYNRLDRSVLLSMMAAEHLIQQTAWESGTEIGMQLGSSRGATALWEQYHHTFTQDTDSLTPPASPLTTAGNLATHTAQHIGMQGLAVDSSITCSTALHALANAVAWIESGRHQRFIAGGTEAPLTSFTLAQMRALKIYASPQVTSFPNQSLNLNKKTNTMVLGEGSALFAVEANPTAPLAWIAGIGYAREDTPTLTAVSKQGEGLQRAMQNALNDAQQPDIDLIICHCPGTILGDKSEYSAISQVFGENVPSLTSNKWKIGHTLGASGGLSLEMGLLILQHQQYIPIPYLSENITLSNIKHIMVNALGFGGNAISIILARP